MDLDALEAVHLTGLADLHLHRENLPEDLADGRGIGHGREQDSALFDGTRVRPFVIDELPFLRAVDRPQLQPSLAEGEVCVDLEERAEAFRTREERPCLAEVFVSCLELDEELGAGVHAGREREMDKKVALISKGSEPRRLRRRDLS